MRMRRNADNAAKEAANLKKKQNRVLAKQGELPTESILQYALYIIIKYAALMDLPPPVALSEPPLFEVGARAQSFPDTAPGIAPEHSVAV